MKFVLLIISMVVISCYDNKQKTDVIVTDCGKFKVVDNVYIKPLYVSTGPMIGDEMVYILIDSTDLLITNNVPVVKKK